MEPSPCRKLPALALVALLTGGSGGYAQTPVDVALHRPYSISPKSNYPLALDPSGTVLTGKARPSGRFWSNGTTVGWSWTSPVIVSLELGQTQSVESVKVGYGANREVGIARPAQVLVFGGDKDGRIDFLGASPLAFDKDQTSSSFTGTIDLTFPAVNVDRLIIVAYPRGGLMFLGRIEAFAKSRVGTALKGELASPSEIPHHAAAMRRRSVASAVTMPEGSTPSLRLAAKLGGRTGLAHCAIHAIDPWTLHEVRGGGLVALVGGAALLAWRIDNWTDGDQPVVVETTPNADLRLQPRALSYVQALDYSWVPDVAAPFHSAALPPHSSMYALLEIEPARAGTLAARGLVSCGGAKAAFDEPVRAIEPDPGVPPLHGNLWAYIDTPVQKTVARALACDSRSLARFGLDTMVIPPAALFSDGVARPDALLQRYFAEFRGTGRALLFMDVRNGRWTFLDMPQDEAVASIRNWWHWVRAAAASQGYTGELVIYPIDEPTPADLPRLANTQALFRHSGIDAKFYATIDRALTPERLRSFDILQIQKPDSVAVAQARGAELQSYYADGDARLLSPNEYYRSQGWRALKLGLKGVGTWSLWDSAGADDPASGWSPFGYNERDFGMLYGSPDGCAWPSLRLLAWRRGIEENRIMRQCNPVGMPLAIATADAASLSALMQPGRLETAAEACARAR